MDDPRIEWLRNRVYLALDIQENEVFEEFLSRDEGEAESIFAKFLNETPEIDTKAVIFFYKAVKEEFEEIEVECGKLCRCYYTYNLIQTRVILRYAGHIIIVSRLQLEILYSIKIEAVNVMA